MVLEGRGKNKRKIGDTSLENIEQIDKINKKLTNAVGSHYTKRITWNICSRAFGFENLVKSFLIVKNVDIWIIYVWETMPFMHNINSFTQISWTSEYCI